MITEDQLNTLRDFSKFAPKFLNIRTKSGKRSPFAFNRAQIYLHDRLEKQKESTGKVRAILLKGRQMGCCFSPQMRVLNKKYQWVALSDVSIGDELFSVDENPISSARNKKGHDRKIRVGIVEAKIHLKKEAFEVSLSNGATLVVTGEHRMLFQVRGGTKSEWRQINKSKIGDSIRAFCLPPTERNSTFDDGWFSGLLDGEGSIGSYETSNPRLALTQVDGIVLEKAKKYLRDNNIHYYELIDNRSPKSSSKFGEKPVHLIRIDRRSDMIKILTMTQPVRLIEKTIFVGKSLPNSNATFDAWVKIESIKSVGEIEVIDLQTSTKTFICEGLISHNSTYIQARYFHKVITSRGKKAFILTHDKEATKNLFGMAQRFYENLDPGFIRKPDTANAKEMYFRELDSGYAVGTAGNKSVGRSQTIQLMHASEVAYWAFAEEHSKGILQAVSNEPGTEILMESTANGIGNYFHQRWLSAMTEDNEYQAIFLPWYWQNEYTYNADNMSLTDEEQDLYTLYSKNGLTPEHLAWRRLKIREFSKDYEAGREHFNVEYPMSSNEAFKNPINNVFILSKYVDRARNEDIGSDAPLVIGVDVAISDRDRTAIIRRKGRLAFNLERFCNYNTMETVGRLKRIITEENPAKVFVDCIGVGAGVVDRLQEMGFDMVVGVNVARSANDKERFKNLRAELWSDMRDWLYSEMPVQIPDSDELHGELCSLGFKENSSGQLQIESKDDLRARGLPSPDGADALSLTFYGGFHGGPAGNIIVPKLMPHERSMFR